MSERATLGFWRYYRDLPVEIQRLADSCYELLRQNPRHHSLHLKKVQRFWSARVGLHYRALAVEDGPNRVWFWTGTHSEYDRRLGHG